MSATITGRLGWGLAAAALVGAFVWAGWPRPVAVETATIGRATLEVTVEDEGLTRIREVYTVSAPTTAKLQRSPLTVGDAVTAGETVVARFTPVDPSLLDARAHRVGQASVDAGLAAVVLAEAQAAQAGSQLDFARSELKRAEDLAAHRTIAERALEKARLDVATAEAALASAVATVEVRRQELTSARAQLIEAGAAGGSRGPCCVELTAPVGGRVLKIHVESEQVVAAGAPLVDVGDPDDLEIAVDLLSRDAVRVVPGATARIDAWGGASLSARVRRIEPIGVTKVSALGIEEQRVKVVLDFVDPPATRARLGHGYRVVPRIVVWRGEDVPTVPIAALFRDGDAWAVFTETDGRARTRRIEIGERTPRAARLIAGLAEGERVILHAPETVRDGVAIRAIAP